MAFRTPKVCGAVGNLSICCEAMDDPVRLIDWIGCEYPTNESELRRMVGGRPSTERLANNDVDDLVQGKHSPRIWAG